MADKSTRQKNKRIQKTKRRRSIGKLVVAAAAVIVMALIIIAAVLYGILREYSDYSVKATVALASNGEKTSYTEFSNGYLKCGTDGIVYFNKSGIVWDDPLSLIRPLSASCENYAAIADTKGTEIRVYDSAGYLASITALHNITALAVSKYGAVAAATNDGEINYVEIYDKTGEAVLTIRTVFASSGYLSDIALSADGTKLVASFICVGEGSLKSGVLFYDFSVSDDASEYMVGGFNQYDGMVITNVNFMQNDVVCVVSDGGFSLYSFSSVPTLTYEDLDFEWEIQTLIINDTYIGFIVNDESSEYNYVAKVYDTSGKKVMDAGFDFAYTHADFSKKKLLLYSSGECRLYSFSGKEKFACTFGEYITGILYSGSGTEYVLATSDSVEFIKLK